MVWWLGSSVVGWFTHAASRDRRILTTDYTDYTERVFSHKEQEDIEDHYLTQRCREAESAEAFSVFFAAKISTLPSLLFFVAKNC